MTPLAWCTRSCNHLQDYMSCVPVLALLDRSLGVNNNSFITTTSLLLEMVLLNLVTCMKYNAIYFFHSSVSI